MNQPNHMRDDQYAMTTKDRPVAVDELLHAIYSASGLDRPLYLRVEIEATRDGGVCARAVQRCHDADVGTCDDEPYELTSVYGQTLVGVLEELLRNVEPKP